MDSIMKDCFTEYMYIYVEPISIDTTMAYKPIKAPIKQGITLMEATKYMGTIIVLAGLIFLVIHLIKRSKNKEKIEEEEKSRYFA